jgi:hypothetical protein
VIVGGATDDLTEAQAEALAIEAADIGPDYQWEEHPTGAPGTGLLSNVLNFAVTDLDDLVLHWDPDAGITVAPDPDVTAWEDEIAAAIFAVLGGNEPARATDDDRTVIEFTAANSDALQIADALALFQAMHRGEGACIAVNVLQGAGESTLQAVFDCHRASATRDGFSLRLNAAAAGTVIARVTSDGAQIILATVAATKGDWHTIVFAYEDGRATNEYDLRVDGASLATGDSTAAPAATACADPPTLGALATGASNLNGSVQHIVFLDAYPSANQLATLEAYLASVRPA